MGFFCYNCGREVDRDSDCCPGCGVQFKAVKCPSCGYTDQADFFRKGCPRCGYMAPAEQNDEGRERTGDSGKPVGKPILGFIPVRLFWFSGFALLILLLILIYTLVSA